MKRLSILFSVIFVLGITGAVLESCGKDEPEVEEVWIQGPDGKYYKQKLYHSDPTPDVVIETIYDDYDKDGRKIRIKITHRKEGNDTTITYL